MSALVERIQQVRMPPTGFPDPVQLRRAAILNNLCLATIGVGLLAPLPLIAIDLISMGSLSTSTIQFAVGMFLLVLVAVGAKVLLQKEKLRAASWLLLGAYWMIATGLAIASAGIRDITLMAYLVICVLAAFTLGRNQVYLFGGLSLVAAVSLYLLEVNGLLTVQLPEFDRFLDFYGFALLLIFTGLVLQHILSSSEQTVQEQEERSLELETLDLELQKTLQLLDQARMDSESNESLIQLKREVARDAVSIPSLDRFLTEAADLIANRTHQYHVGIFTLDEEQDHAVLRAASSEGGKRLLDSGHQIPVGKAGLVGFTTGTGKPRIANEVDSDPIFSTDPELPFTRAELALPLLVDETILGALDVQSDQPEAFNTDDIDDFGTIADLIGLAIRKHDLQEEISTLQAEQANVLEAVHQLKAANSYDSLLALSTTLVRKAFGALRVTLGVKEGDYVVIRSCSARAEIPSVPIGGVQAASQSALGQAIATNEPVRLAGPMLGGELTPPTSENALATHTYATPLRTQAGIIGAIAMEYEFTDKETDFTEAFDLFATLIGLSLENAQLQGQIQENQAQLDELYRGKVHEDWMDYLESRAGRGSPTTIEFESQTFPVEEIAKSSQYETPIELRGETIGKLAIQGVQQSDWSDEDLVILQSVADEVAGTLEQMRLMEELERRATQLQTASEVARDATGQLDESTLLRGTVELIRERFELYHVSVLLLDESGKNAYVREAAGEAEVEIRQSVEFIEVGSQSIVGQVTKLGESYIAHDVTEDPNYQAHPLLPETKTEFVVPLKIGVRVIGALDVQGTQAFTFTDDDIAVFEILADQLAVAIQNARLFEEARQQADREKAVTEIGAKIRASSDIDAILQTTVLELQNALGASRARISMRPFGAEAESMAEPLASDPDDSDGDNGANLMDLKEGQE
jgi:GAF domain-containing protein